MKLSQLTREEIEKIDNYKRYRPTKFDTLIEDFIQSGKRLMKVTYDEGEYVSNFSACSAIRKHIKTRRMESSVQVHSVHKEVILFNMKFYDGNIQTLRESTKGELL